MKNSTNYSNRSEIPAEYKWKIEEMYASDEEWEKDFAEAGELIEKFASFAGKLTESADSLLEAMKARDALWLKLEKVYVYAHMRQDEDNREARYQSLNMRSQTLMSEASAASSFFTPELLSADEEVLRGYVDENSELSVYRHAVDEILRMKAHVLTETEENLMARFSEITGASKSTFTMLNNADMKFGKVTDENGEEVELTHGNYISFLESHDRRVREEAFRALYAEYEKHRNTLGMTYSFNTKKNVLISGIRHYDSALSSALESDNIPESVYTNLIDSVNAHLPSLHKYLELRKRLLKIDDLRMFDVYVPLVEIPENEVTWDETLEIMYKALAPLGEEYISDVKKGVASGWIDVMENEGKTSGAYSFGSYDSMPYILMNFSGKLKDVFTVVHEMGHSMNSYYTRREQPFIYGGHSIFTAEVASTVNECLLTQYLLKNAKDDRAKLFLINQYIEGFRTTLFRQTMFAEFEKIAHEAVGRGEVLTPDRLCEEYGALNRKYFGEGVTYDSEIEIEWARIPHFYNAFYVYKYATGYSAAVAIADGILSGRQGALEGYLQFLANGECDYPIELLKGAGVDMSTPDVVDSAMKTFDGLIDELEKIVGNMGL